MLNHAQLHPPRPRRPPPAAVREPLRRIDRFAGHSVLVMPGLHGSGPDHWQSAWERRHPGFRRVEQADWSQPELDAWARRLVDEAIKAPQPVVVVAHSFGCLATVRASVFQSGLIAGALLVAPAEPLRFAADARLPQSLLPFPTTLVASTNDPYMTADSRALGGALGQRAGDPARCRPHQRQGRLRGLGARAGAAGVSLSTPES